MRRCASPPVSAIVSPSHISIAVVWNWSIGMVMFSVTAACAAGANARPAPGRDRQHCHVVPQPHGVLPSPRDYSREQQVRQLTDRPRFELHGFTWVLDRGHLEAGLAWLPVRE